MSKPYVKNAADSDQVRQAGEKEERGRERDLNDMRTVLSTLSGRRVVWRYLTFCKVFESSFTGNSTTFFNEGMRNVGLALLADIHEAEPQAYLLMMQESKRDV